MADKIVKVTLEMSDGTVKHLSGVEAERWEKAMNGALMIAHIRGVQMPDFPWVIDKEPRMAEKPAPLLQFIAHE
jgi:outer membrane PBP1 activator LpoA protein